MMERYSRDEREVRLGSQKKEEGEEREREMG